MALLGAYLTWYLGTDYGIAPWWSGLMIVAVVLRLWRGAALGLHALRVAEMASMLITFSIAVIVESLHPGDLDRRFPPLRDELWPSASFVVGPLYRADAQPRRLPRRGGARRARPGRGCAGPMSARRCAPAPRTRRSPPRSASTIAGCPICCRASARPMPGSRACSSRSSRRWRRRRSGPGSAWCLRS